MGSLPWETGWRFSEGHCARFWRMNMNDSGRWLVANIANNRGGMESIYKIFCRIAACCTGETLKPATTFPLIDAGLSITLCPGPPIPSICQNTREGYLYQEEPAWLIPIHLQLLQLRQHSHSGKTGYLRVILLFELFVLFWNLWHLKNRPAFQVIDQ